MSTLTWSMLKTSIFKIEWAAAMAIKDSNERPISVVMSNLVPPTAFRHTFDMVRGIWQNFIAHTQFIIYVDKRSSLFTYTVFHWPVLAAVKQLIVCVFSAGYAFFAGNLYYELLLCCRPPMAWLSSTLSRSPSKDLPSSRQIFYSSI